MQFIRIYTCCSMVATTMFFSRGPSLKALRQHCGSTGWAKLASPAPAHLDPVQLAQGDGFATALWTKEKLSTKP
jgi:hypothetical protein